MLRELVKKHGAKRVRDLTNGGVAFKYKGHCVEIYPNGDKWTFAFNESPAVVGCWEFMEGDLDKMELYLQNPESLWGW